MRRDGMGPLAGLATLSFLLAAALGSPPSSASQSSPRSHAGLVGHHHAALIDEAIPLPLAPAAEPARAAQKHGPRAVAHHAGGVPIRSAAVLRSAPEPRIYPTGTQAAEPTLGITKAGAVFYVGLEIRGFRYEWPVLMTKPGAKAGEKWTEVSPTIGPQRRHVIGLDPMLHVDRDTGRIFTADIQAVVGCSAMVSFSDDHGKSWTSSKVCGLTDHQNIFSGPPPQGGDPTIGYPNVVYYCAADGGMLAGYSTMSSCVKSLDGGITWVRTGEPAFMDDPNQDGGVLGIKGHCAGLTAHGFVDAKGTVYLPRGWCGQPYLAISKDEGRTWTRVQVADNGMAEDDTLEEHEAAVGVDKAGNIYYVWTARNRLPYLSISRDAGKSWSEPMMIGLPGLKEASLPAMDVAPGGALAISYIGSTNAPGGKAPDGSGPEYQNATWNGYTAITTDALADDPVFYTASHNHPSDPLVRGGCPILRCQQIFDFIDVDIAPDGTPWTALVDGCVNGAEGPCETTFGWGVVGRLVGGPPLR